MSRANITMLIVLILISSIFSKSLIKKTALTSSRNCHKKPILCDLTCPEGFNKNIKDCICEEIRLCGLQGCPFGEMLTADRCSCVPDPNAGCEFKCSEGFTQNEKTCECIPDEIKCELECPPELQLNLEECRCERK